MSAKKKLSMRRLGRRGRVDSNPDMPTLLEKPEDDVALPGSDKAHMPARDAAHSPYYRQYVLLIEYKHLKTHAPGGVYVMPAMDSLLLWHGVIFVRQGKYRGGVFKFFLEIPESYPNERPRVQFFSQVFHPQIGEDGTLNLSNEFPQWEPCRHYLVHVLAYIKRIFYQVTADNALNKDAARLLSTNEHAFRKRVRHYVDMSKDSVYINPDHSSIRFTEHNPDHDAIVAHVLKRDAHGAAASGAENAEQPQDVAPPESMVEWLSSSISKFASGF